MPTQEALRDAIDQIGREADNHPVSSRLLAVGSDPKITGPAHGTRQRIRLRPVLAPIGAVAAVTVVIAGSVLATQHDGGNAAGGPSSLSSAASVRALSYRPPATAAQFASEAKPVVAQFTQWTITSMHYSHGTDYIADGARLIGSANTKGAVGELTLDGGSQREPFHPPSCYKRPGCSVQKLPGGAVLAITTTTTTVPSGSYLAGEIVTEAEYLRPDGKYSTIEVNNLKTVGVRKYPGGKTEAIMAVSGPRLPLTTDQVTAIVTSDKW